VVVLVMVLALKLLLVLLSSWLLLVRVSCSMCL
jgi:hypothetical protein